jgi:hypothetical protein
MKSKSSRLIIFTFFFLLLITIHPANGDIVLRTAGGIELLAASGPYIKSPENATYDSGLIALYVSFHALIVGNVNYSMSYSLDGKENETVVLTEHYFGFFKQTGHPEMNYVDGFVELPVLTNGSHYITTYIKGAYWSDTRYGPYYDSSLDSQTVYFTVLSPIVLLMQESYNSTVVPLDFYINGSASQIVYSLDNQANTTIAGNTTLTGLPEGTHTIDIYTPDDIGRWVNFDTITFNVINPSSSPLSPFAAPNHLQLASLVGVVAVAVSLLMVLRKRKSAHMNTRSPNQNISCTENSVTTNLTIMLE